MQLKKTVTYFQNPPYGVDSYLTAAWAWRVSRRLELCAGWFYGPPPTLFYFNPNGHLHLGTVALTLRVWRLMVGWRWHTLKKGAR